MPANPNNYRSLALAQAHNCLARCYPAAHHAENARPTLGKGFIMNEVNMTGKVAETARIQPVKRRRSVWIWLILGWAGWSVFGLIGMWWSVFHPITDAEAQQAAKLLGTDAAFVRPNIGLVAIATINTLILAAGAWSLLLLRSLAIRLFVVSFAVAILTAVYSLAVIPNYSSLVTTKVGMGGILFSLIIYCVLLAYAVTLRRRGVLR